MAGQVFRDPINVLGKLNASVLLAVTPEYRRIKSIRHQGAGRAEFRSQTFAMKPEFREIADIRVRFAQGGKEDGPTVLLLSPLPQSILCYDPIWNILGEHCRLVALDLPGFGGSSGGMDMMNFASQGKFLMQFVVALDLHNVHIVGPDVGMPVALHYVMHHKDHRAASILVGDGPSVVPTACGSIINKAVYSSFWRLMFRITGAHAMIEGTNQLACVKYVPTNAEVADYLASYKGRIGQVTHWFKSYPENLKTIDPYIETLDLPVQIFWGNEDALVLLENAHRLHERLPRSALRVFEDCGHFSYQDKADEFAKMVLNWVEGSFKSV